MLLGRAVPGRGGVDFGRDGGHGLDADAKTAILPRSIARLALWLPGRTDGALAAIRLAIAGRIAGKLAPAYPQPQPDSASPFLIFLMIY
jgi:hypothetical protein